jgi:hypothetical protein
LDVTQHENRKKSARILDAGIMPATDFRWAAGNADWIRMFAKELVGLQPDVILAQRKGGGPAGSTAGHI